jgi:GTP-binding protein HflX
LFRAYRRQLYVADRLFATLDPTVRRLQRRAVRRWWADTVGFIRDLPHERWPRSGRR